MRDVAYCDDCGARLTFYVVGVCPRCSYDLTGDDPRRDTLGGAESQREGTEA